jgi:hypothetical protein
MQKAEKGKQKFGKRKRIFFSEVIARQDVEMRKFSKRKFLLVQKSFYADRSARRARQNKQLFSVRVRLLSKKKRKHRFKNNPRRKCRF